MLPKYKPNLQLVNLVIVDVAVVLFTTLLISRGIVPLYPGAAIGELGELGELGTATITPEFETLSVAPTLL